MSLDDPINRIRIRGHKGPHPERYHQIIHDRLSGAVKGTSGAQFKAALEAEMHKIRNELLDESSVLDYLLKNSGAE